MSNSKKRNPQAMPSAHDDNQRTNACVSVSAPAAPVMVHGFIEGCHQHGGRHAAAPRRLLGAALTLKPCAPWMRKKYSGLEERLSQRNLHQQSHLCPSGHFLNDRECKEGKPIRNKHPLLFLLLAFFRQRGVPVLLHQPHLTMLS